MPNPVTTTRRMVFPIIQSSGAALTAVCIKWGQASVDATVAAPLLQQLADNFGGVAAAGVAVENAFSAVPKDVPININMPGGQAVLDILKDIGAQVQTNKDGEIHLSAPLSQQVLDQLKSECQAYIDDRIAEDNRQKQAEYLCTFGLELPFPEFALSTN